MILHVWAEAHQNFPSSHHMNTDPTLPNAPTIHRLFGSIAECRAQFRAQWPDLARLVPPERWTAESVLVALTCFWQQHYRPALIPDLRLDKRLPSPRIVYERFGGLEKAYQVLNQQGVACLQAYHAAMAIVRTAAGRHRHRHARTKG